jgi:hypothetical protein
MMADRCGVEARESRRRQSSGQSHRRFRFCLEAVVFAVVFAAAG